MADGVWRASGRLGCANVVPGAGLTHAMSGIAEAWMDNVPWLPLTNFNNTVVLGSVAITMLELFGFFFRLSIIIPGCGMFRITSFEMRSG